MTWLHVQQMTNPQQTISDVSVALRPALVVLSKFAFGATWTTSTGPQRQKVQTPAENLDGCRLNIANERKLYPVSILVSVSLCAIFYMFDELPVNVLKPSPADFYSVGVLSAAKDKLLDDVSAWIWTSAWNRGLTVWWYTATCQLQPESYTL